MLIARNAVRAVVPSNYNAAQVRDDISLIQLDVAVAFSATIKPIQLPARSQATTTYANNILTVAGYGLTNANQVAINLQYATVIGLSNNDCRSFWGAIVTPSILCAQGYPNTNSGVCDGKTITYAKRNVS